MNCGKCGSQRLAAFVEAAIGDWAVIAIESVEKRLPNLFSQRMGGRGSRKAKLTITCGTRG